MEFLKLQKDYDYDGTTVFKTIKLVHPNTYEFLKTKMFCKTVVFNTLKIFCIQTGPKAYNLSAI